jgi:ArsR family transcriptional regulator
VQIGCRKLFQLLSDSTRLRCTVLLRQEGELCVCELVHALGVIQPKVSRHLAALRDAGVVTDRRDGQWIYYRINPDLPVWAREVIEAAVEAGRAGPPFAGDRAALSGMPDRPQAARCP